MDSSAVEYGVCKGTVCLAIQWVEDTLVKDGTFALPGKKAFKRKSNSIQYVVVDVTESPINPSAMVSANRYRLMYILDTSG
jgi:hypothetical protein